MGKHTWILAFCLALVHVLAPAAFAQNADRPPTPDPLIVGFSDFPPFMHFADDGTRTGFVVDLAEEIGVELGIDIQYHETNNVRAFVEAQVTGTSHFIPGIARLPPLQGTNVFSTRVATETQRVIVLSERVEAFSGTELTGMRIGIVPPAVGSQVEEVLQRNIPVEFASPEEAILDLLSGRIDGVLGPNATLFELVRRSGMDQRLGFIDPPVQQVDRFAALHQSRADLLRQINAAIAQMQADGRLAALRSKYFIDLPKPPPAVLRVGIFDLPPHMMMGPDGTPSGFAVDVLRDVADIAGLQLEYTEIPMLDFAPGATHDVLPMLSITPERARAIDFSQPFQSSAFSIFVRAGESDGIIDLASLRSKRVAFPEGSLVARVAQEAGLRNTAPVDGANPVKGMLADLVAGNVDAVLFETNNVRAAVKAAGYEDQITEIEPPFFISKRAIALRPGLGIVRERLDEVIPSYLISQKYQALRDLYFGETVFWTTTRIYSVAGLFGAIIFSLMGTVIWQRLRQRRREFESQRRELELEQAHTRELGQLVRDLQLANREQAEFTYAISHDLKSPTNTMSMLISELEDTADIAQDTKTVLSDMKATNRRMGQLVDDVLNYSRVVDEQMQIEPIDANTMVDGILKDLASDVASAGAEITRGNLPDIHGNPMQIRLLFQNLISNAVKFRAPDRPPKVEIAAVDDAEDTKIVIADNGIGIPETHRERVFGLFQRLHSQSDFDGTGLGLAICRRVMTNHGGEIFARPARDGGTAFELIFRGGRRA